MLAHQIDPTHFIHDPERARCAQLLWYRGPLPDSDYAELPPRTFGKVSDLVRKRLEEQMGSKPGSHFRTTETARARVARLARHLETFHDRGMNDEPPFDAFSQPVMNDMQHFYETANFTIAIGGATHPELGRVVMNAGNAIWEFVVGPVDKITSHLRRRGRAPVGEIFAYEYAQYAIDRAGARFGARIADGS